MSRVLHAHVAALALAVAACLASRPAPAQPAPNPSAASGSRSGAPSDLDPAAQVGIAFSAFGAPLLIAGGALTASDADGGSVATLGAGAGMTLVGGAAIFAGVFGSREHMSEDRMLWGLILMGLAAAGAGAGAALWAAPNVTEDALSVAGLGSAAGFASIGLPLLVSGAPAPQSPPTLRSPAMAYAGYALFGLTFLGVTAGVLGIFAYQSEGGLGGLDAGIRGMTAVGFAGSLTLTGIPLVAAGSQPAGGPALSSSPFGLAF